MNSAELGDPPPLELRIAFNCQRWNTLPEAGGYYQQDYQLITRMGTLLNVYNAITRMKNLPGKEIHRLTENERRTLRALVDIGLIFNG